jgi:hypothetical protein
MTYHSTRCIVGAVLRASQEHPCVALGLQGAQEETVQRIYLGVAETTVVGIQYYEGHVSNREMVCYCT